jgi:hypothetical protein
MAGTENPSVVVRQSVFGFRISSGCRRYGDSRVNFSRPSVSLASLRQYVSMYRAVPCFYRFLRKFVRVPLNKKGGTGSTNTTGSPPKTMILYRIIDNRYHRCRCRCIVGTNNNNVCIPMAIMNHSNITPLSLSIDGQHSWWC